MEEKIQCQYGKHLCNKNEFSLNGLNKKYFTQCRKCKAEEMRKYREKYKDEYNEKHKLYERERRKKLKQLSKEST